MRFLRLSFLCLATLAACTPDDPDFADAAVDAVPDVPIDLTAPETTLTASPASLTNVAATTFEFTSNQADATFRCSVDGSPAALCDSPYTMVATEGEHTFAVFAVSATEIADETPAEHAWRVDLTPPETTITMGPAALDNSVATEIGFEASEAATFACTRDGGAAAPCTSPFMVDGLTDGDHVVTVRATDEAGNVEPEPATHAWTVDTTAPDTVIDTGPTGFVASAAAQFTFSSPNAGAGAVFECALDSGAFATCVSPRNLTALAEGMHTFQVRVRDAVGNLDPTPAQRQWTVDTIAPTVMITGGPSGPISDSTPTFTFTTGGAPTVTECRVGTGAFAPCSATFTPAALADGAHTFEVRVRDAAGNTGNATRAFTVDTIAPTVMITGGPSGPTGDSTPTFTFTTGGSPATITCAVGGQSGACTTSFTPTALADGSYTFTVTATDAAGNSAMASRAFSVDTGAPTVMITGGPSGPTNDSTPTFTFTTSGNPATTTCSVGAQTGPCTTSFTPTALGDGSYTFTVTVADAAGNSGQATRAFSVDTVAPTVNITSGPNGPTNDSTPTFGFTTAGSPTTITCAVGSQSGACTTTYTPTALGDGSYTFTVTVADAAGNTGTATRPFSVDTQAPTVMITSGPNGPTNDSTPTFGFTTAGSPTTITCAVGSQSGACTTTYTPTALGDGSYTFTVTVADAAGNTATATRPFSVDTQAPTVNITSGPTGPTTDTTPTFDFTVGGSPTTRTCSVGSQSGACTTSYTPTALADGNYTFTVTVADAAGNTATATRMFSVDTQAPTVTIMTGPNGPTNDSTPTFGFTTAGSPTTITCAVGSQSGACTTSYTPSALADGSYTFSVTVRDAAGNQNTATRAFSVDTTGPTANITMGPNGPTNDSTPTFGFTTAGAPATITCSVGSQSAPCTTSYTPANPLADGSYTFTITMTDALGNVGTATRAFSVDTMGPTANITMGPNGPTNDSTPTFGFTTAGAPVTITCSVGSQSGPCTTSYTPANPLADGSYTFTITMADALGNVGTATRAFSVDTMGPTANITMGPNGPTNDSTPTFGFTTAGAPATITCSVGSQSAPCTTSYTPANPLADGSYTFTITMTDALGNVGTATRAFSVDTMAPTVTINTGPSGATNDNTPTFTFTTGGSPTTVTCTVGTQSASCPNGTFTAAQLADGGYTFTVTVRDAAGNQGSASRQFSVDTVGPTIVINGGPTQTVYSTTTTFRSTASGSYSFVECRNFRRNTTPPSQWFACATPSYTYNVQFPVYPPDTYAEWTFQIRVRDAAGNTGTSSWNYSTGIII